MATSSSSRTRNRPVNLTEVRHEQRRVAALLNASGQIKVTYPPHDSIPVQDLYKSRFYRELQAARSLPNRIPPLGHPLVRLPDWKQTDQDNALVSNQYRHFGKGDNYSSVAALAPSFQDPGDNQNTSVHETSPGRAVALRRTLSKSVPSSLGVDASKKSTNVGKKSLSRYESLPDIGHSARQGNDDGDGSSKVEFRLPRWRRGPGRSLDIVTEGSTGPPHLQYNHGIVDLGKVDSRSISQIFSPTGWLRGDTDTDIETMQKHNQTRHRKRKHQSLANPLKQGYEHERVPFNSPESSTSSMCVKTSSRESGTTSSSTIDCDIDGDHFLEDDSNELDKPIADKQNIDIEPSCGPQYTPGDDIHQPKPKGSGFNGSLNPNDDPYGTAYVKALSVSRSKALQKDPFYLSHRLTRPFTFSYFCHNEVCTCGKCPKMKRKKGKLGFKSILGDVNMYDYFKWSKDGTQGH
nr:uncharacterized protein LOC129256947 [Lytechinus pictus]